MSGRRLYAEWIYDGMNAVRRILSRKVCLAIAIPLFAFTSWVLVNAVSHREVRVVTSDGRSVVGVTVSHVAGGTWQEGVTDQDGIAEVGRGPWFWPGSREPVVLLVREGKEVLWSGTPRPRYRERVRIELSGSAS